jgi:hypothetical protein
MGNYPSRRPAPPHSERRVQAPLCPAPSAEHTVRHPGCPHACSSAAGRGPQGDHPPPHYRKSPRGTKGVPAHAHKPVPTAPGQSRPVAPLKTMAGADWKRSASQHEGRSRGNDTFGVSRCRAPSALPEAAKHGRTFNESIVAACAEWLQDQSASFVASWVRQARRLTPALML